MRNKKFYSLNLLRGIAGYGVAITHYLYFVQNKVNFEYYSFIFVEIFFVLSGFVLSNQLLKVYNDKENLKIFYLRRFFRTIPLYLVALIFFTTLSNNFNLDFFKFLFFIQKIVPNFVDDNYFMVAWSLSIEECFYLIFPIYLIFFGKFSPSKLVISFVLLFSLIKILNYNNFSTDFLRTGTFLRIDSIALGFLLGIFFDKLINYKKMIVLFLLISIFFLVKFEKLLFNNLSLYTLYFIFISQFLSILLVLFFCNLDLVLKNKLIQQICNILASQTYSVYLFHLIVMHFLIMANSLMINNIFVYIFLLLIISSLIYKYFEKPILMLRPKYKNE